MSDENVGLIILNEDRLRIGSASSNVANDVIDTGVMMSMYSSMDTASLEGLSPIVFVNLPQMYKCVKCKNVLSHPVQTPCGHLICRVCGDDLKQNGTSKCPAGEPDCEDIKIDTLFNPDKCAVREMKKLIVFCPFKDYKCEYTCPLNKLSEHVGKCPHARKNCNNHGCSQHVALTDLDKHEQEECGYQNISCTLCSQTFLRKDQVLHDQEQCPMTEEPCPNRCGEQCIRRKDMEAHKARCRNRPLSCGFTELGCDYQGSDEDVRHHENTMVVQHFRLSALALTDLKTKNLRLENIISEKMANEDMMKKNIVDDYNKKIEARDRVIHENSRKVEEATATIASMQEERIQLMADMTLMKDEVERLSSQVQRSESLASSLLEKVANLEQQRGESGRNTNVTSRLMAAERMLSTHASTFSELHIRMQCLETTSFNGVMTWKISDYNRRKGDANDGRTLSLYSQPFYTHRNGYKICLRVYLNGDGIGKGSYMSLFFVIMKGEYDNLMRWPFQQRVTLKLLRLDPDGGMDVVDSFVPDVTSSSFQKPRAEMNVASGCPMFVRQDVLRSSKYLKDDSIFINVEVDTNNCFI